MQELLVAGHSFGGPSAIEFACGLGKERCKALIAYDAWLLPHREQVMAGEVVIKCPVMFVNSFHN